MTERFYIKGGIPLKGEVLIGGAKNSVLKLIAAALLVKGSTKIYNVPDLTDVDIMLKVVEQLGAKIDYNKELNDIDINSDYIVISPFSKSKIRTYSPEKYVKIIDYITETLKLPVMIIGNSKEKNRANNIKQACKNLDMVYNTAGMLSLSEVILYIRRAKLLVANETGTVHIAKNFGTKTVCISNGSYMYVFQPYPQEDSGITYLYPDNIKEYVHSNNLQGLEFEYDINKIDYSEVIKATNQKLCLRLLKVLLPVYQFY